MSDRTVRKAVLPAAGYGTRFLPATKAQPKETLPIVDRPAIQYMIEEADRAGLDDLLIITGRNKQPIEDHFDRNPELEDVLREKGKEPELDEILRLARFRVHYVRQAEQLGLGHAVLQARQHVGEHPFAVLLGDDIIDPGERFLERMLEVFERTGRPVVAVMPVPEDQVHLYGVVSPAAGQDASEPGVHRVDDLVEKPEPADAPSNLAVIGRYVLTPDIFEVLAETPPGRGGEIQLTDALRTLADREPIIAVEFDGARHDVGDKLGFLKATVALAADRADLGPEFLDWLRTFMDGREGSA